MSSVRLASYGEEVATFGREAAAGAQRLGDAWLLGAAGDSALTLVPDGAKKRRSFAKGSSAVRAFTVAARGDEVVVAIARANGFELWSTAGKRRWRASSSPVVAIAVAGEHVLAVDEAGALVFASVRDGEAIGKLRLASPDAPSTWHLVATAGDQGVLALGEWLVWVDGSTRKTVRRVKARAKVRALACDGKILAAGCEDGGVQAFDAMTGELTASFDAHAREVVSIALADGRIVSADAAGNVARRDRAALERASREAAPVTALAARGDLVAAADREGHVHIFAAGRRVGSFAIEHASAIAVGIDGDDGVWAASSRSLVRAVRPWSALKSLSLRRPATAIAADAAYAFAGDAEGNVDVFDRDRGTYVTSYALSDAAVTAIARLPGKLLVVGTNALDGFVYVVDVTEATVRSRIEAQDDGFGVTCLAADARGRIVASGSDAGAIALLDPVRGRVLARIDVGETPVSLAFEPSGRRLACSLADGTAAIVTLGARGASVAHAKLRGVARVAWGLEPEVGFADGRVARLDGVRDERRDTQ